MTQLVLLQIATSFFVGGLLVAALSLLAERVPPRVAGVILNLPSTLAVSFFFMAIALSPKSVANALPIVPAGLSFGLLFIVVYLLVARIPLRKSLSMMFSSLAAGLVWLTCSVIFMHVHSIHFGYTLSIFLIVATAVQLYFFSLPLAHGALIKVSYSTAEKAIRALIAGALIAIVVYISKVAGPVWGTAMSTFPAATLSVLLILHRHYSSDQLARFCRTAPIGFTTLVVYAILCTVFFPHFGAWLGTFLAYAGSLLYVLPLVWFLKLINNRFSTT